MFSAEISASDAVLFMLTTSLSQDLYKRFVNVAASDADVLRAARWISIAAAAAGAGLAIALGSVVEALTIFYSLLGVSLFVPIIAGLFVPRTKSGTAMGSIVAGVAGMLIVQAATAGRGWHMLTPALAGLIAAVGVWLMALVLSMMRGGAEQL